MPTNTYQPNETDSRDSYVNEDSKATNYGTSADLIVQQLGGKNLGRRTTIIEFDITDLPSDATVTSASLDLYANAIISGGGQNAQIASFVRNQAHPGPWVESEVSWDYYAGTSTWYAGAGTGPTNGIFDYASGTQVTKALPTATGTWTINDATFVAIVQNAITTQSGRCALEVLRAGTGTDTGVTFDSSSGATSSQRPKLTVTYTVSVSKSVGVITFTGSVIAPAISIPVSKTINASALQFVSSVIVPTINISSDKTVNASVIQFTSSVVDPTIETSVNVTYNADVLILSSNVIDVSLTIVEDKTVNSDVIQAVFSIEQSATSTDSFYYVYPQPVQSSFSVNGVLNTIDISPASIQGALTTENNAIEVVVAINPLQSNVSIIDSNKTIDINVNEIDLVSSVETVSAQSSTSNNVNVQPITASVEIVNNISNVTIDVSPVNAVSSLQSAVNQVSVESSTLDLISEVISVSNSNTLDVSPINLSSSVVSLEPSIEINIAPVSAIISIIDVSISQVSNPSVNVSSINSTLSLIEPSVNIISNATLNVQPVTATFGLNTLDTQSQATPNVLNISGSVNNVTISNAIDLSPIQLIALLVPLSDVVSSDKTVRTAALTGEFSFIQPLISPVNPDVIIFSKANRIRRTIKNNKEYSTAKGGMV